MTTLLKFGSGTKWRNYSQKTGRVVWDHVILVQYACLWLQNIWTYLTAENTLNRMAIGISQELTEHPLLFEMKSNNPRKVISKYCSSWIGSAKSGVKQVHFYKKIIFIVSLEVTQLCAHA